MVAESGGLGLWRNGVVCRPVVELACNLCFLGSRV